MSLKRKLFVGGLWATADGWATETLNLLVFLILVRLLGPEQFGLVALAAIFTTVAVDLTGYSVSRVLIQKENLEKAHCDTVFIAVVVLSVLAAGLISACSPLIATLFGQPMLTDLLRWLSLGLVLNGLTAVPIALLTRDLRFGRLAVRSFAMIIGGGIVGIYMALQGYGAWALVGQSLAQSVISVFVLFLAADWRPGLSFSWPHLADVRAYALNTIGIRVVGLVDERTPQFVIGYLLGPAAVGYFNIAVRITDMVSRLFIVPISQVAMPGIAKVQHDLASVRGMLAGGIRVASTVSAPAFLGLAVIAPQVVPVVLGEQWLAAIPVLQLLALAGLVSPVTMYGKALLYAVGRPSWLLTISLINLGVRIVLLLLVARYGIIAVAAAGAGRLIFVTWPMIGYAIGRLTGVGLLAQARSLLPAVAAASIMAGALLVGQDLLAGGMEGSVVLVLSIAIGAILYLAATLVVNRPLVGEAIDLLTSLRERRSAGP